MRILLLLGLLQPPPSLDCGRHRGLCSLLGPRAPDFAAALWRLRLLQPTDLNHQAARLRAEHSVASGVGGGPMGLQRVQWRLYGARESVVIGRSFEEREGLWLPSSARVCLETRAPGTPKRLCANEDYLAFSSPTHLGPVCLRRGAQELCLD